MESVKDNSSYNDFYKNLAQDLLNKYGRDSLVNLAKKLEDKLSS